MTDLASLDHATFAPCVGQTFDVVFTDGRLSLTLAEARKLGKPREGATRDPFVLVFHGAPALRLPQHIYRLEHATLGSLEIFLVQTGANASSSQFEANFN